MTPTLTNLYGLGVDDADDGTVVAAPTSNYYGGPHVARINGQPVFGVIDHDDDSNFIVVSEEFYAAFVAEFQR